MAELFKAWFVNFEGVSEKDMRDSELGLIPKGWQVVSLAELCSLMVNGGTPRRSSEVFWNEGQIPWFKTGELFDGFLLEPSERITERAINETSVKVLPRHSILMAIYASPTVGRLGVLTENSGFNQACTGMVAHENIGPWFLFQTLKNGREWFNSRANGAAQQNISKEIVSNYKCVLPDEAALSRYNNIVRHIYSSLENNSRQVSTITKLRDTLLPRLISGRLRRRS